MALGFATAASDHCKVHSVFMRLSQGAHPHGCAVQVVYGHLDDPEGQEIERGVSYLKLRPGAAQLACMAVRSPAQRPTR